MTCPFACVSYKVEASAATSTPAATTAYTPGLLNQYTAINPPAPAQSIIPHYDLDGNLLAQGQWTYTWDAERRGRGRPDMDRRRRPAGRLAGQASRQNRLATATSPATGATLSFTYDSQNRRVRKTATTGATTRTLHYLYDGWNLLAELVPTANGPLAPLRTHLWSLDLSGSPQGAGGVGGLLATTLHTPGGKQTHLMATDGNGNITAAYSALDGSPTATFDHDPFGQPLAATGPVAADLPFRFSTKYLDPETSLYYYGHRYYTPSTGRWLSRDPIEEQGGNNLYQFCKNNSIDKFDVLGQWTSEFRGTGWTASRMDYFDARLADVKVGVSQMLQRTDQLIAQAQAMSEQCCLKERLIKEMKLWKRLFLTPTNRRLNNSALNLPVELVTYLPPNVEAQAWFPLGGGLGYSIATFEVIRINKETDDFFNKGATEGNRILFHELSHISGTTDNAGRADEDEPAAMLWDAHYIDDFIKNPGHYAPLHYFGKLEKVMNARACTDADLQWGLK